MLNLDEVLSFYPLHLRVYRRFILREYLQYKILQIIFESEYSNRLAFMGGTCLRIIHNNQRFSEDLDFDNFGCSLDDFFKISELVKEKFELEGIEVEIKTAGRQAYHCYFRFPNVLFYNEISQHKEEKILIQLDSEAQNFIFEVDRFSINKFDVFTEIFCCPLDLLLSQKCFAILNRKRSLGRDFFDVVYLLSKTLPNYQYLKDKIGIGNGAELKSRLLEKCESLEMSSLAKDVEPFLFRASDSKVIINFEQILSAVSL